MSIDVDDIFQWPELRKGRVPFMYPMPQAHDYREPKWWRFW
jgi:hypothetical protein